MEQRCSKRYSGVVPGGVLNNVWNNVFLVVIPVSDGSASGMDDVILLNACVVLGCSEVVP